MAEHRSAERDLDRYLNDLASRNPPENAVRLDPGDVEMIWLLRSLGESPHAHTSRDRVRAKVDAEIERAERGPRANGRVRNEASPVAETPVRTGTIPGQAYRSRRPASWLSAAVAGLIAIAVVAIIAIAFQSSWRSASDERTAVPAVVAPATPEPTATPAIPGVSQSDLIELELPAEAVPAGLASVSLSHLTLLPGDQAAHAPRAGIELDYVISGQLAIQVSGEVRILRANTGAWESIPTGTPVSLSAGDAVLFIDLGDDAFANSGPVSSEVLAFGLVSDAAGSSPFEVPGWIVNDYALAGGAFPVPSPGILLPGAPVVLRVNQAVLEPQALMPAVPLDQFQLTVVVPDNGIGTPAAPNVAIAPDGRTRNLGVRSIAVYSVTLEIPGAAGTPLAVDPDAACPFPVGTALVSDDCDSSEPGA